MKSPSPNSSLPRIVIAGLLGWVFPGAGHLYIGERVRGLILMAAITLTFWGGIAIGGVKNTVNPQDRALWFLGQVCAGVHPFLAIAWGRQIRIPEDADKSRWIAYGQMEDISVVYTAIAGMLNILAILDVLVRAEKPAAGRVSGSPGTAGGRAGP
ncbi:MAG TPA: DUF6677 family protein [Phycisphaerae bacterium]|nr:DUF6677 family protein [Phycisphaerae bacterium]